MNSCSLYFLTPRRSDCIGSVFTLIQENTFQRGWRNNSSTSTYTRMINPICGLIFQILGLSPRFDVSTSTGWISETLIQRKRFTTGELPYIICGLKMTNSTNGFKTLGPFSNVLPSAFGSGETAVYRTTIPPDPTPGNRPISLPRWTGFWKLLARSWLWLQPS